MNVQHRFIPEQKRPVEKCRPAISTRSVPRNRLLVGRFEQPVHGLPVHPFGMGRKKGRDKRVVFLGKDRKGVRKGERRLGGAEDAWSALTRPQPVYRRLRSCAVSSSTVPVEESTYGMPGAPRVSLTPLSN